MAGIEKKICLREMSSGLSHLQPQALEGGLGCADWEIALPCPHARRNPTAANFLFDTALLLRSRPKETGLRDPRSAWVAKKSA